MSRRYENCRKALSASVAVLASTFFVSVLTTSAPAVAVTSTAGPYVEVAPARLIDTRHANGPVPAGGTLAVKVDGVDGVPASGVTAVALNVTVIAPTQSGYLTVFADGTPAPHTSNIQFAAGETVAESVIAQVGATGEVDLLNNSPGATQVIGDVQGYYSSGSGIDPGTFQPVTPTRLLDSRQSGGPLGSHGVRAVQVDGGAGLPSMGVAAVAFNVTVVGPTAGGDLVAYADGTADSTSNVNFSAGQTVANLAIVAVGADGKIEVANGSAGSVQFILDVEGYYLGGTPTISGAYTPVTPTRLFDSRPASVSSTAVVQVNGTAGIANSGVAAVALNVTVIGGATAGDISVSPDGAGVPSTSSVNFAPHQTVANLVIAPVAANGRVDLNTTTTGVNVIVDVEGYVTGPAADTTPPAPVTGLNASPAAAGPGLSLSWVNPADSDFAGVVIRRSNTASAPAPSSPTDGTLVASLSSTATSYIDTSAVPQTEYNYSVFSHDAEPNYGSAASVTSTTTSFAWHSFGQVDPYAGHASAISCPTTAFCMTVDQSGQAVALVNGARQSPVRLEMVIENGPVFDALTSVSCASTTFCMAVNGNGSAFVYRGSTWSAATTVASGQIIRSVSCVTSSFCKAAIDPNQVSTWNGSAWSTPTAAAPSSVHLSAISCTSTAFCAATGVVTPPYPANYTNYAIVWNGSNWSAPTKILSDAGDEVWTISCVGTKFCIAVGDTGFWIRYNGTTWITSQNQNDELLSPSVSCTSPSFCVLVGLNISPHVSGASSNYNGSAWSSPIDLGDGNIFEREVSCVASTCRFVNTAGDSRAGNGLSWGAFSVIDQTQGDLGSVSCATTSFCVAIDGWGNFVRYNGTNWTVPARVAVVTSGTSSVSCPSSTFCLTVDSAGHDWTYNGSSWTQRGDDGLTQGSASCASPTYCVAIDSAGSVAIFNGSTWSKPTSIASGFQSYAISCTSARFCGVLNLATTQSAPDRVSVLSGGVWRSYSLGVGSSPRAISCAGSNYCTVTSVTTLWVYAGGRVTSVPAGPVNENFRLSCVSASECVANGRDGTSALATEYVINGASVSPISSVADPVPTGYASDISCVTPTWCMAGDQYGVSVGTAPH